MIGGESRRVGFWPLVRTYEPGDVVRAFRACARRATSITRKLHRGTRPHPSTVLIGGAA